MKGMAGCDMKPCGSAIRLPIRLEYAHSQGVLHLALKPDDVLLDQEGNVLISGFGIERGKHLNTGHIRSVPVVALRAISAPSK